MNARCKAFSSSPLAKTSTVRICLPSACTANIRQERTGAPSTSTVQAPQTPCSQPICVPVCPQSSRMESTRVRRGSTRIACALPLIVSVTSLRSLMLLLSGPPQRRADALRRGGYLVDAHAKGRQRIIDGVEDRCRRADGAAFAEPLRFGDSRVAEGFEMQELDRRNLAAGRRQEIRQRCGQHVA